MVAARTDSRVEKERKTSCKELKIPSKRQRSECVSLASLKARKARKIRRPPSSEAALRVLDIEDSLKVQQPDDNTDTVNGRNSTVLPHNAPEEAQNATGSAMSGEGIERPQPVMWPALIRVYEDRMVRVTILRREITNLLPSATPSVTARVVALSALLASAAALSPMCGCMSSASSKLPAGFIIPYSHGKPLHFGSTSHSSRGYAWIKTAIARDQSIPFVTAAAAAADVVFYRAILSLQK